MTAFKGIALVRAHPRIPLIDNYYISDLTELCSLGAVIKDDVDWVTIPVTPSDRDPLREFAGFLKNNRPDMVGISSFTCGANAATQYARLARASGAFVVLGGYHPTAMPEQILQNPDVDAVVRGEGEMTFRELVSRGPSTEIAGLSFRDGARIVHNEDRRLIMDLDTLPLPAREIRPRRFGLDTWDYHTDTVYTSRGCTANCRFCANNLVHKQWRMRSNENVIEELLTLIPRRTGKRQKLIKLWDANFMTHIDRVSGLCDMIIEHGLHRVFRFYAETRVGDVVRGESIIGKMREANIQHISLGIESPHQDTLKAIRKGGDPGNVSHACALLRKNWVAVTKYFVLGHPNESEEQILQYADYALDPEAEQQRSIFFLITPYPGTETHQQYKDQGIICSTNWDMYTNFAAVVKPNNIPPHRLQALACATAIRYNLSKVIVLGRPSWDLARRFIRELVTYTMYLQINDEYGAPELDDFTWYALSRARVHLSRPAAGRRSRWSERLAFNYYHQNETPLLSRLDRNGGQETLYLGTSEDAPACSQWKFNIHLKVNHIQRLIGSLDIRRLQHDFSVLHRNPRCYRPLWLLEIARQAWRSGLVLIPMLAHQVKCMFRRSRPGPQDAKAADATRAESDSLSTRR